ncbi:hypothetical protein [Cryobacterium serini]|uniref:Uncharacterized protein n=1 Tax=Cryobacterium serini TaxID=1259201 RepID=A0A4R9BS09_9MICO|nr:hypothetical protein [Cryobacterium serini]TFD89905.1 hypothetical protein E3T51_04140 [Cryobacterium serini]
MARHCTLGSVIPAFVLVVVLMLSGCVPYSDTAQSEIQATGAGVALTIEDAPSAADDEQSAVAIDAAAALPVAGAYLMLRPSEITANGPLSDDGVQLRLTLPAALPEGAAGSFAYFDAELGVWASVATEMDGRDASAMVSHLSTWTFVVSGTDGTLAGVVTVLEQTGDVIDDAATWWDGEGDGWLYRNAGLLLGTQAGAPECTGELPSWAQDEVISFLVGRPKSGESVLRCAGVDPDDKSLIQIKAVANRAYGFTVEFAAGVTPKNMQWSQLEGIATADVDALAGLLADTNLTPSFLDPREFLIGTTELSFSVAEEDVRAVPDGAHLVLFGKPDAQQVALSLVYKMAFDSIEGQAVGFMGVVLALRDCDPGELLDTEDAAAAIGWVLACIKAVDDEGFQKNLDAFTTEASAREDLPPAVQQFFKKKGVKVLRTVLHALKWLDVATLALWNIDYAGERTDDAWYVDIILQLATWEDIDGVWCGMISASDCSYSITLPTNVYGEEITSKGEIDGCFLGMASLPEYGSAGSVLAFCPAGVPTAPFIAQNQPTLDNPAFDRIWYYNGYEPPTMFREGEAAAAMGG